MSERQEACWDLVTQMKGDVLALLDSENDGVRTHAIKFTESLIITLSPRTSDSDIPKRQENDTSLDKVPKDHLYIRYGNVFFYGTVCHFNLSNLEILLYQHFHHGYCDQNIFGITIITILFESA